jgi:8-oxo-dGTP pyrophosphatase MutT (NUDIX family)
MHTHKQYTGGGAATNTFTTSIICTNCSTSGHASKQCPHPITSYGVILFRVAPGWNQAEVLLQHSGAATGYESMDTPIEFLLIQRRDTIGFIEIMRGKYKPMDYDYIIRQLAGMTGVEREKLRATPFDTLWEELWGPPQEGTHAYKHEKDQARVKLDALRAGTPTLDELIAQAGPAWDTPEWGFPKGRRDLNENEYACAMRELWEETNILEKDILPVRNMEPIVESFTGSNHVQYCHKYFIAYAPEGVGLESIDLAACTNEHIRREVSAIQWLSAEDAIQHIRPESVEKRDVLLRVSTILKMFCPLRLGAGGRSSKPR